MGTGAADDIAATLRFLAIGLPGFSCWMLLTASYQALQDTRSLFFLYLLENSINISAALLLFPLLGVDGLGLAYALAYIAGIAAGLVHLHRKVGRIRGSNLAAAAARIGGATAAMSLVVAIIAATVGEDTGLGALLRTATGAAAGVTVYLVAARALGVNELRALVSRGGRR